MFIHDFTKIPRRKPTILIVGGMRKLICYTAEVIFGLGMGVVKTVTLNLLEPTKAKRQAIDNLRNTYQKALSFVVSQNVKATRMKLQSLFYQKIRENGLHSQVANDLFKDAVAILNNGGRVSNVTVPFNIPRSGNFGTTSKGNPVVCFSTFSRRVAVPIAMDGAYQRFRELQSEGYATTFFRLSQNRVYVVLKKDFPIDDNYEAIIGVDVGVKSLAAVSIINREGRVLKQLYLGQDVGDRQRDVSLRRSKLQSHRDNGSRYARQALRRLKKLERHYVATRCWQVAHEIVKLAERYNAFIAVEDLKGLKNAKGNRKGNRKAKRMPYHKFRAALESVAWQKGRLVVAVYPRGTSHICPRCGSKGLRDKAVFHCPNCGYEANSDRGASVNIALRAGVNHPKTKGFFISQFPERNLAVNQGVLVHDGVGLRCLRHFQSSRDKPINEFMGS
jgi:IS605 OrfB family transposase